MPDYDKSARSALASIRKAGLELTASRKVPGVYDAAAGEETTEGTVSQWSIFSVILPATVARFRGIDNKLTEDGLVLTKARYLLTAALNDSGQIPEPLAEDTISFPDETVWRVIGASPLKPATTALIYQIGIVLVG